MTQSISTQIHLSRDAIRQQITDHVKTYLELENVDLTKSSFLSFLINIISTLTGNLMFYQISTYKEFFLTKAQLPESILNLSAFLGYSSQDASYASANILIKVPLTFQVSPATFTIPEEFKFYANDIDFITHYTVTVTVINNTSVTIVLSEGSKRYNVPFSITNNVLSFVLPLKQYKVTEQEFQIDEDTPLFQFVTLDVPISGKVAEMIVEIKNPGDSSFTTWTEFNSIYLMSSTDKGYVSRRTDEGQKLYFGNSLIGVQPVPGATIRVTVKETEGADGNAIAGSIKTGGRIYTSTGTTTQIVNYTVTNPSPATNGKDEESMEDIRKNAIASLTALGRLVSESDYKNIDVVIPTSPLAANSLPVLKRSDVKVNEIEIFTTLLFGTGVTTIENLVPSRNVKYTVPITTTFIPRETIITLNGVNYITLFDMTIDLLNSVANYNYTVYSTYQTPILVTSYNSSYDLVSDNLTVSKVGNTAVFELHYTSTESDYDLTTCEMEVESTSMKYSMVNDTTSHNFVLIINPYTSVPENNQTYYFTISDITDSLIAKYSGSLVFRKNLTDFMRSNTVSDSTNTTVYDIPVVKNSWYNGITKEDFENQVLQIMMTSMDFVGYKMLTDFANVKLCNTTGTMENMKLNPVTKRAALDILSTPPVSPSLNDRYIVAPYRPAGAWVDHGNEIAYCVDTTSVTWMYIEAVTDDILFVGSTKYIYSGRGWLPIPDYQMPLEIEVEVFKDEGYSGTYNDLVNAVRDAIVTEFNDRFGPNVEIYRSEIDETVQNIEGVDHCRIVKPESSIFYSFRLDKLTEDELLEYGPEYVYFTEDSITVRIL